MTLKRIILAAALLSLSAVLGAQEYTPHQGWPLLYENFEKGVARTNNGALVTEALLNISVLDGSLMYVDSKNTIMKADISKVYTVRIGKDEKEEVYVNIQGKLYKLISELDLGCVVLGTEVDEDKLSKVDIGYGVSSASGSAMNLTILMDGRMSVINKSLEQSNEAKFSTPELPVKHTRYIYTKGYLVPASRNSVVNFPGVDKKEAQNFIKQEKIKWKETGSLEKLVIFLNKQLSK